MNTKNKLIIIGAGEFAEIAFEYFTHDSEYDVVAFCVDEDYLDKESLCGLPVFGLGDMHKNFPAEEFSLFVAIPASDLNQTRTRLYKKYKKQGYNFATYISSYAFVWKNVKIGENCFIFENNTVQPFVEIGQNVVMWSGNHVGHRSVISDNVFLSSHVVISGYCKINENCFLGVNSTLNDGMSLPAFSILASGSLVSKKLEEENRIYIGNPAKPFPRKEAKSMKL